MLRAVLTHAQVMLNGMASSLPQIMLIGMASSIPSPMLYTRQTEHKEVTISEQA